MDKWRRAQAAVRGGVNLVIELPFNYACKSAEFFAAGGITVLNATRVVTDICFGAECDDGKLLSDIAGKSFQADFTDLLKAKLQEGKTYAKAVEIAVKTFFPDAPKCVHQPNSILAVEYIKALAALSCSLRPHVTKRVELSAESRPGKGTSGASSIRSAIIESRSIDGATLKMLPAGSAEILQKALAENSLLLNYAVFEKIVFYRLRQLTAPAMNKLADFSEGLENRVKKAALNTSALSELIERAATRRYPKSRIMRILSQLAVLTHEKSAAPTIPYLRVLAFDVGGRELIKKIKAKTASPVIINLPDFYRKNTDELTARSLDADISATDLFHLLIGKNTAGQDFRQKPIYVE
jgi:predicted nucleotidyltransferase